MSKNLDQVFIANPITTNASTDLMYFMQSPYTSGTDAAMTYANFSAQFMLAGTGLSTALTSAHIFVGNGSNVATDVALSGDASLSNTGALTVSKIGGKSITLANSFTTSGNFTVTQTYTNTTNVTFPTTGTLATTSQLPSLPLSGANGGTGVANTGLTINLGSPTSGFVLTSDSSGNATWQAASSGATAAQIQNQAFTYGIAGGSANTYTMSLSPAISSYTTGLYISFQVTNSNTAASTININSLGAQSIILSSGAALTGSELLAGEAYVAVYNVNGSFTLLNPSTFATSGDIQKQTFTFANGGGTPNTYAVSLTHAPTAYTSGMYLSFITTAANTGASTMNVNGLGAVPIVTNNGSALVGGEILVDGIYQLIYNPVFTEFVLLNSSLSAGGGVTAGQIQSQAFTYSTALRIAPNTYSASGISPAITSYTNGQLFCLTTTIGGNTGAATLNINSIGATPILNGYTRNDLIGGEIVTNYTYLFFYTGGNFYILNPTTITVYENTVVLTPTTGSVVTLTSNMRTTILNPAGTLASLIIVLPDSSSTPNVRTNYVTTISTTQIITSLNVVSASSGTVLGAPTALTVGQSFTMILNGNTYYPG